MKVKKLSEINETLGVHKDDDDVYVFNLRMKDIRKIIVLIFGGNTNLDMDDLSVLKSINISVVNQQPSARNGQQGGEFVHVENGLGFVIKIWENGFVAFENGLDVMFKFDNVLEVYEIILDRMK